MARNILDQKVAELRATIVVDIVLPKCALTPNVTEQYCRLNLLGEWFSHDKTDDESLGDCYH